MGSIQDSTMILCALGNRSASFLSRRAHLLTTSSEQTPYHSLCLWGQSSLIPLFLLSPKSLATFRGPFRRWYFRWKPCALRGGCGCCDSLMSNATILRDCCHRPRSRLFCYIRKIMVWAILTQTTYANCPHKPASGRFVCGYDPNLKLGSFSL